MQPLLGSVLVQMGLGLVQFWLNSGLVWFYFGSELHRVRLPLLRVPLRQPLPRLPPPLLPVVTLKLAGVVRLGVTVVLVWCRGSRGDHGRWLKKQEERIWLGGCLCRRWRRTWPNCHHTSSVPLTRRRRTTPWPPRPMGQTADKDDRQVTGAKMAQAVHFQTIQ